jgi:hypothetical protein
MWSHLLGTTLADLKNEQLVCTKYKLANSYTLRVFLSYTKNHPLSQSRIFHSHSSLFTTFYELTQSKYKERGLTILGNDIVTSLTNNKQQHNDGEASSFLQKMIDQQNEEKRRQAQKKREEIMRQMNAKKAANKFV